MENDNKNTDDQNTASNDQTKETQPESSATQTQAEQPVENTGEQNEPEQMNFNERTDDPSMGDLVAEMMMNDKSSFQRSAVVVKAPWYIRFVWFLRRIFTRSRVASTPFYPRRSARTNMIVSSPFVIVVRNKNNKATKFSLFNSYESRTTDNFANPEGIEITNGLQHVSYAQLLGQIEFKPERFGTIYMSVVEGLNSSIVTPLTHVKANANGHMIIKPIIPRLNPFQQMVQCLEHDEIFDVDGGTEICGEMPANTCVQYYFYPFREEPAEKVGFWKRFFRAITFRNRKKTAKYALAV